MGNQLIKGNGSSSALSVSVSVAADVGGSPSASSGSGRVVSSSSQLACDLTALRGLICIFLHCVPVLGSKQSSLALPTVIEEAATNGIGCHERRKDFTENFTPLFYQREEVALGLTGEQLPANALTHFCT